MPSSVRVGGSRMSMIATSGGEPWMRATRSSALSELATTSRPAAPRIRATPFRGSTLSSAMATRTALLP
jgi:hypothetical protein